MKIFLENIDYNLSKTEKQIFDFEIQKPTSLYSIARKIKTEIKNLKIENEIPKILITKNFLVEIRYSDYSVFAKLIFKP